MAVATKKRPRTTRRPKKPNETYQYLQRMYLFDVDLANEIVADGREPVEVEEESARKCVEHTHINQEHVPTVDPARPGIIAHIEYPDDDGQVIRAHLLIDGNHRAARCLELNRPFFAFLLSEEESQRVLLHGPTKEAAANKKKPGRKPRKS